MTHHQTRACIDGASFSELLSSSSSSSSNAAIRSPPPPTPVSFLLETSSAPPIFCLRFAACMSLCIDHYGLMMGRMRARGRTDRPASQAGRACIESRGRESGRPQWAPAPACSPPPLHPACAPPAGPLNHRRPQTVGAECSNVSVRTALLFEPSSTPLPVSVQPSQEPCFPSRSQTPTRSRSGLAAARCRTGTHTPSTCSAGVTLEGLTHRRAIAKAQHTQGARRETVPGDSRVLRATQASHFFLATAADLDKRACLPWSGSTP